MSAQFIMSAPTWTNLPTVPYPELAITGRSNVGKSSLLGILLNKAKLVRVSRTPGRTQLLNLFVQDDRLAWVDLPGYGYAKLSHAERSRLHTMSRSYLALRPGLSGVLMLVDARRESVSELDKEMAHWVLSHRRPLLIVATKADLVPKNRRIGQLKKIEASLGVPQGGAMAFSSRQLDGLDALRKRIGELTGAGATAP